MSQSDSQGRTVAVVTGSAQGIGEAICRALAEDGALVVGLDIRYNETELPAARRNGPSILPLKCDVGDRASVREAIDKVRTAFGAVDVLVNNAAWIHYVGIDEVDEQTLGRMLDVGLKSIFWTTQAVLPDMENGGGAIVNVTSIAAKIGIPGGATMYGALKGGADSVTRHLAVELANRGIRVNAVAPGSVPTPGMLAVVDEGGVRHREKRSPLGLARVEDIAQAVKYLVSPASAAVTGHTLVVDGGMSVTL